jgi:hypothetical protein
MGYFFREKREHVLILGLPMVNYLSYFCSWVVKACSCGLYCRCFGYTCPFYLQVLSGTLLIPPTTTRCNNRRAKVTPRQNAHSNLPISLVHFESHKQLRLFSSIILFETCNIITLVRCQVFLVFIYIYIYIYIWLFNEVVSISDYIESNCKMISD